MQEMRVQSLGQDNPSEEGMVTYSNILAWRSSMAEQPGELQSIGSQRVRHDWSDWALTYTQYEQQGWMQGYCNLTASECFSWCLSPREISDNLWHKCSLTSTCGTWLYLILYFTVPSRYVFENITIFLKIVEIICSSYLLTNSFHCWGEPMAYNLSIDESILQMQKRTCPRPNLSITFPWP